MFGHCRSWIGTYKVLYSLIKNQCLVFNNTYSHTCQKNLPISCEAFVQIRPFRFSKKHFIQKIII